MITTLILGFIYALLALGVYLTFRILNFPDLTVDGSFTTGAAVSASLIVAGVDPYLATLVAFAAGALAGVVTGLLHTKGNINGLLAGILTMIALWSVNLRIMNNAANVSLLREETVVSPLRDANLLTSWVTVGIFAALALLFKFVIDWFLKTNLGVSILATGDNEEMIRSFGVNTDNRKILTLAISNGLVAVSGALIAQYQAFADITLGIGMILIGLASVIVGEALIGRRYIWVATLAAVLGAVIYRLVIYYAMAIGLNPNDMKFTTAVLVVLALLLPQASFMQNWRAKKLRAQAKEELDREQLAELAGVGVQPGSDDQEAK